MQRVGGGIAGAPGIADDDTAATSPEEQCGTQTCRTPANDDDIEHANGGAKGSPRMCGDRTCATVNQGGFMASGLMSVSLRNKKTYGE